MVLGIGRKTLMTGIAMTAVSLIFLALVAKFTGFDLRNINF